MDDSGNTKDDLKLPTGTDDADKLAKDIKAEFDDGKELVVTVVSVHAPPSTDADSDSHPISALLRHSHVNDMDFDVRPQIPAVIQLAPMVTCGPALAA